MTKSAPKSKPLVSIVTVNYNSGDYLLKCLESIDQSLLDFPIEIITLDNHSPDGSFSKVTQFKPANPRLTVKFIPPLAKNIGFSASNNVGIQHTHPQSQYLLFLNPDTTLQPDTIANMVKFFTQNPQASAATCNLILVKTGQTQPECHRGFPTPLNSFWHFFGFGLPALFPKSKFFNGYFLGHLDFSQTQQIDACVGAFLMIRRSVGQAINWWSEDYFFYGEDLDLCYTMHQQGYKLFFFPGAKAFHFQGISSGIIDHNRRTSTSSRQVKVKSALASTQAMKIFYRRHLYQRYHPILRLVVMLGIEFQTQVRLFKAKYL